ncbi:MGMT family protein [Candidatus Falkowbacteria bacterium]|nr:MGMT family protein [Candidatus Falkowbacteria bacterium]
MKKIISTISPFASLVYSATKQIPRGRISTYGAIAQAIGRPQAARAVGQALNRNPYWPAVPCQRVVGSTGQLTGFATGLNKKRQLLQKEGITIKKDRVLNFAQVFYQPHL